MANKKIPFKYARPVEEWLQEKGNFKQACFYAYVCSLQYWYNVKNSYTENVVCSLSLLQSSNELEMNF